MFRLHRTLWHFRDGKAATSAALSGASRPDTPRPRHPILVFAPQQSAGDQKLTDEGRHI